MRKNSKIFATILVFVFAFSIMLGAIASTYADSSIAIGSAAKTTVNVNFRKGPGINNSIISVIKKGSEVKTLEKVGRWYKIQLANGKTGYVYDKYLSGIDKKVAEVVKETPKTETKIDISKLEKNITLATTTSTQDTGLLDTLVPAFTKKYGVNVKVIAVGTGEAIEMGKRGDADVILVHSRKSEDAFVAEGFGVNRKDVMYNFYVLVGPKDDPAKVGETKDVVSAMAAIANSNSTFISRGDESGTHKKEKDLWKAANIVPQGNKWYMEVGQGMGATLTMANEQGAYTLADSGTWYAYQDKVNMKIVLQGDKALFNPYGVIAVNPAKYTNIGYNSAMAFAEFITSEEGQKIIKEYKKNGFQLFVPDAK
ncbi:MAG: substrate-binding domain-containing protein [Lutispora sp.]